MATAVIKHSPPEKFHKEIGIRGAYGMDYEELFSLPFGSTIRIENKDDKIAYVADIGTWKEYGELERDGKTIIFLPLEYFTKFTL